MDKELKVLEIVAEIASETGDPLVTAEAAKESVARLYWDAKEKADEEKALAVVTAWEHIQPHIQRLVEQGHTAISLAVAAREAAAELQSQRDDAIQAHEDLLDALQTNDTSHPVVAQVWETMQEMVHAGTEEETGFYSPCLACDVMSASPRSTTTRWKR